MTIGKRLIIVLAAPLLVLVALGIVVRTQLSEQQVGEFSFAEALAQLQEVEEERGLLPA